MSFQNKVHVHTALLEMEKTITEINALKTMLTVQEMFYADSDQWRSFVYKLKSCMNLFCSITSIFQENTMNDDTTYLQDGYAQFVKAIDCRDGEKLRHIASRILDAQMKWNMSVRSLFRFKLVIWGATFSIDKFIETLNPEVFDIRAILDERAELIGRCIGEVKIISPATLVETVDCIAIMNPVDQERLKLYPSLRDKPFINCSSISEQYKNVYNQLRYLPGHHNSFGQKLKLAQTGPFEVFVTGSSYAHRGIDERIIERDTIKLCLDSQDLYYDFRIAQTVLKRKSNYKYAILGLSYYAFDHDLSLAKAENYRIASSYLPIFGDAHHLTVPDSYTIPVGLDQLWNQISFPFSSGGWDYEKYFESIFKPITRLDESLWNAPCEDMPFHLLAEKRATKHSTKDHQKTRIENQKILRSYLGLLYDYGVRSVLVIFPVSRIYKGYFSPNMIERFYKILNDIQKDFDFQFIDAFNHDYSADEFADCDHLNLNGAKKFTMFLNKVINW